MELSPLPGKLQKFRPLQETFIPGKTKRIYGHLFCGDGNRKPFATLRATPLDDKPAILGGHADKKTMGSLPGSIAGLEGSFHISKLLIFLNRYYTETDY